ncbi:MAG: HNH endonuclease [Actinomycetota bacterium]|nr:HNH endonuclease [Actinomycetota bacterium]
MAVPQWLTDLLGCDGTVSPIYTEGGLPVNVGRTMRIPPDRTRRIVIHRDGKCRVPWCSATRWLQVHHVIHDEHDGPTDTNNLIAICGPCHRLHHRGRLGISGDADQPDGLVYTDEQGRVIDPATRPIKPTSPPRAPARPYRHPLGEPLQRDAIMFREPPAA